MRRTELVRRVSGVGVLVMIVGWILVVWFAVGDRNPTVGFKVMLVGGTLAMVPLILDLLWCLWHGGVPKPKI